MKTLKDMKIKTLKSGYVTDMICDEIIEGENSGFIRDKDSKVYKWDLDITTDIQLIRELGLEDDMLWGIQDAIYFSDGRELHGKTIGIAYKDNYSEDYEELFRYCNDEGELFIDVEWELTIEEVE